MPSRKVEIPKVGSVLMSKRRGMKNIRVSVTATGSVRVNIPSWTPYRLAERFVIKHIGWINEKRQAAHVVIRPGDTIGRNAKVFVEIGKKTTIMVNRSSISVRSPHKWDSTEVQTHLKKAADKVLKMQADSVLPDRINRFSRRYRLKFNELRIKRLMSRWGSCSAKNDISLSIYLIQLPDELIDYVIVHELVHTKHRHHGRAFWNTMELLLPQTRHLRKKLRAYSPILRPQQ